MTLVNTEHLAIPPQKEVILMGQPPKPCGNGMMSGMKLSGMSANGTVDVMKKAPGSEVKLRTVTEMIPPQSPGGALTVNTYTQLPPQGMTPIQSNIGDMYGGAPPQQQQAQQQQQQQIQYIDRTEVEMAESVQFSFNARNAPRTKIVTLRWEGSLLSMQNNPDLRVFKVDSKTCFCKHIGISNEAVISALGDLSTAMIVEIKKVSHVNTFPVGLGLKLNHAKGIVYDAFGRRFALKAPANSQSEKTRVIRMPHRMLADETVARFAGVTRETIESSIKADNACPGFSLVLENSPIIYAFLKTFDEGGHDVKIEKVPRYGGGDSPVVLQIADHMVTQLKRWCFDNIVNRMPYDDLTRFTGQIYRTDIGSSDEGFASTSGDLASYTNPVDQVELTKTPYYFEVEISVEFKLSKPSKSTR